MNISEQIFINHIEIKFQIRKSNISSAPALIYGIFTLQNHTYRISTLLKVYPNQWNSNKQRCLISPRLDTLSNKNNAIANRRLNEIEEAFNEKIIELSNNTLDADVIKTELIHVINIKHKSRMAKKRNQMADVTEQIKTHVNKKREVSERTKKKYNGDINLLKRFLKENKIPDRWENMTYETWKEFKEFLMDGKRSSDTAYHSYKMLKNWLFEIEENNINGGGELLDRRILEIKIKTKGTPENYVPLQINEIRALYDLTADHLSEWIKPNEIDKTLRYRDFFILQCLTGVRVSDLDKIFNGSNVKKSSKGFLYFKFLPNKNLNNEKVVVAQIPFNIFDSVEDVKGIIAKLFDERKGQLRSKLNNHEQKDYNETIKQLCRACKLNREIVYKTDKAGVITTSNEKICDVITSHDGRHTFVTNCKRVLKIPSDEVIKMTGHTDTQYIHKVYDNPTEEDKIEGLIEVLDNGIESPNQVNPYPELPESIEEYKEVLEFFGVNPREYVGISDLSKLLRIYVLHEHEIIESCDRNIDITKIKEIFNVDAPLKDRKRDLERLVKMLSSKNKRGEKLIKRQDGKD